MVGVVVAEALPPPAYPIVAFGIATLATLLLWMVAWGMSQAWKQTIGAGLDWIAGVLDGASVHIPVVGRIRPFAPIASAFRAVSRNVYHAFGYVAVKSQHAFVYVGNRTAASARSLGAEIEGLARDMYRAFQHTVTVTLPRVERTIIRHAGAAATEAIAAVRRREAYALRLINHAVASVEAHAAAAAHAADHALDWSRGRWKSLDRRLDKEATKLNRLSKRVAPLAFAGLVSAALARLGLKWLRCSNTKKAAKRICGMDADLLDELLLGTTLIVGAVSVVEFAKELQAIEGDAVKLMGHFIRELP